MGAERILGYLTHCADIPWFFSSFQESDDSDDSGEEEEEVDEELSKWGFLSLLPLLVSTACATVVSILLAHVSQGIELLERLTISLRVVLSQWPEDWCCSMRLIWTAMEKLKNRNF